MKVPSSPGSRALFAAASAAFAISVVGSGRINAYDATTGELRGQLRNVDGDPLAISGLWGLRLPTISLNVTDPNALYFTAGLNHETDGLLGTLTPNPAKDQDVEGPRREALSSCCALRSRQAIGDAAQLNLGARGGMDRRFARPPSLSRTPR